MGALDPYSGRWDERKAAHLMRRATFVTTRAKAKELAAKTPAQAVDMLLTEKPAPPAPLDPDTNQTWVNSTTPNTQDFLYRPRVKSWWFEMMLKPDDLNITEKLTLCWHNHFATESDVVNDSRFQYFHNQTLRRNCMGNFKEFVRQITIDNGMLRYLNGDQNTNTRPNENYARELQELFTIGKGKEIAPYDYTTYTEDDIRAAAKVLTGWRTPRVGDPSKSTFNAAQHDTRDKQFSKNYGNTVIKGRSGATAGADELNDLLTMIFAQQATAKYIVRKLYRWFVHYEITQQTEDTVIAPLAAQFAQGNYEIKPVLRTLLLSEHFYDEQNIGAMIMSPLDFVAGFINKFGFQLPAVLADRYTTLQYFATLAAAMQQNIMDPPSVAGWTAYHQEPDYYRQWMNSATLPLRYNLTDASVIGGGRYPRAFIINTLDYCEKVCANPSSAKQLVNDVADDLCTAYPLTQDERDYLLTNTLLVGGATEALWTAAWGAYKANPTNATAKKTVEDRTKLLFVNLFRLAEFHLM
ncbi:MAG: DUF1800 domain-containing protein [Candidatus Kapabacteria bacterium]|nr:DUF1800 domain-containing protein [Candidatus Kapabacteria bacterium]